MRGLVGSLAGFIVIGAIAVVVAQVASPAFLSAPAGVPVAFTLLPLPPVDDAVIAIVPQTNRRPSPWQPTVTRLLEGETLIETEAQMRDVWARLFGTPYLVSFVNFSNDFVVLMGGGLLPAGVGFDISTVESVVATYANPGFLGGSTSDEPFLSITSMLVLPGVAPDMPPPPTYRVSAVAISRTLLDDIVFHRSLVALP
ncbi:MAG: hypothetical protein ACKVX7_15870 [Planctomycetota bacterium]